MSSSYFTVLCVPWTGDCESEFKIILFEIELKSFRYFKKILFRTEHIENLNIYFRVLKRKCLQIICHLTTNQVSICLYFNFFM